MTRIVLLALALLTAVWAADQTQGGPIYDPDGLTTLQGDGGLIHDPDGLTSAPSDGGPIYDPNG